MMIRCHRGGDKTMLQDNQITLGDIQQAILDNNDPQQIKPQQYKALLLALLGLADKNLSKQCILVLLSALNPIDRLAPQASEFFNTLLNSISSQQYRQIYQTLVETKQPSQQSIASSAKHTSKGLVQQSLTSIQRIQDKITSFYTDNSSYFPMIAADLFNNNQPLIIALLLESYVAKERRILQPTDLYSLPFEQQLTAPNRGSTYNLLIDVADFKESVKEFQQGVADTLEQPTVRQSNKDFRQRLATIVGHQPVKQTAANNTAALPNSSPSIKLKSVDHIGGAKTMKRLLEPLKKDRSRLLSTLKNLSEMLVNAYKKSHADFDYRLILREIYDLISTADDQVLGQQDKQTLKNYLGRLICQFCISYVSAVARISPQDTNQLTPIIKQLALFMDFYKTNYQDAEIALLSKSLEIQIDLLKIEMPDLGSQKFNSIKEDRFIVFATVLLQQLIGKGDMDVQALIDTFNPSVSSTFVEQSAVVSTQFSREIERTLQQRASRQQSPGTQRQNSPLPLDATVPARGRSQTELLPVATKLLDNTDQGSQRHSLLTTSKKSSEQYNPIKQELNSLFSRSGSEQTASKSTDKAQDNQQRYSLKK